MNTDFKLQSFAFNPAFKPVGQKQITQTPPVVTNEIKSNPTESVTFSTPLKTPRPGSDMAQMMEDLQNNGVLPQTETVSPQAEKLPLREPNSDYMSMMVESVQSDKTLGSGSVHVAVNNNGSIALLDDSQFFSGASLNETPAKEEPKALETGHGHEKTHGHGSGGHGHGHGSGLKEDGLLGGHIGTEVVEKIGHNAHHALTHATSETANHAASETVSHVATEAAGHGAAKVVAHGSDAAHTATEIAQQGAETTSETLDATTAGLKHVSENAHHLSAGLEVALGVGTVGAGILAVPIFYNGAKELVHGVKEKDTDKILEGVGGLAVGTRSAATAAVMGGMLTTSEVVGQVASVASTVLMPLGVVHAGVDAVLGIRDLKRGKTTEGLLKIGTGVAIGAAAVIGGLPLTLVALGMLGVKVGHKIFKSSAEKKAAKAEAEQVLQQQQQQNPVDMTTGNATVTPTPVLGTAKAEVKT